MWSGRRSGPMPPPAWPPWQPAQFIATNSCRPCSSAEGSLAYGFCIVVAGSSPSTCGPGMGPTGAITGGTVPVNGRVGVPGSCSAGVSAAVAAAAGGAPASDGGGSDAEQPLAASGISPARAIRNSLQSEYIQHTSRARVLLDVGHRPDRAKSRGRVRFRHARQGGGRKPTADAGVHGDVLLAVRSHERHRLTDDSRARLELPENLAGARVDGPEPAIERAVEHEIAAGREYAAEERQLRLLQRPHRPRV